MNSHFAIAAAIAAGEYVDMEVSYEINTPWKDLEEYLHGAGWLVSYNLVRGVESSGGFDYECSIYCPSDDRTLYAVGETPEASFKLCYFKVSKQTGPEIRRQVRDIVRVGKDRKKLDEITCEVVFQGANGNLKRGRL